MPSIPLANVKSCLLEEWPEIIVWWSRLPSRRGMRDCEYCDGRYFPQYADLRHGRTGLLTTWHRVIWTFRESMVLPTFNFSKIFTFSFSSSPRMSHNLGKLGGFYRDPDLKSARSLILNINRTPTPTPTPHSKRQKVSDTKNLIKAGSGKGVKCRSHRGSCTY